MRRNSSHKKEEEVVLEARDLISMDRSKMSEQEFNTMIIKILAGLEKSSQSPSPVETALDPKSGRWQMQVGVPDRGWWGEQPHGSHPRGTGKYMAFRPPQALPSRDGKAVSQRRTPMPVW